MNYFNYFTEIEETFVRRRGKNLFLSPLDWALMESWKEREIPLRIILRGINNVFDTVDENPNRVRSIKSLTYCQDEVESLFEDWRGSQVGKSTEGSDTSGSPTMAKGSSISDEASIEKHIFQVIIDLKNAISKSPDKLSIKLRPVLAEIESWKSSVEVDKKEIEAKLDGWEKIIDSALINDCDPSVLAQFKNEIENDLLKHRPSMEADAYQSTFDLMLLKRLREYAEIPRLSLFYL